MSSVEQNVTLTDGATFTGTGTIVTHSLVTGPTGATGPQGPKGVAGGVATIDGKAPDGAGNVSLSGDYAPLSSVLTAVDNGDGTVSLSGATVTDNGDGTVSIG